MSRGERVSRSATAFWHWPKRYGICHQIKTYSVTEYPNDHLLIGIKSDKENAVLAIAKNIDPFREEPVYYLYSPHVSLDGAQDLVFPLHLVCDEGLHNWYDSIKKGSDYSTDYDPADFLEFYTDLGEYYPQLELDAIEITENGFTILPAYMQDLKPSQTIIREVRFEFFSLDGENYFSVDY